MSKLLSALKKVGTMAGLAAPDIIRQVSPPLGALSQTLINGIFFAEQSFGPGQGEAKKQRVLEGITIASPLILALVESAAGRDIADDNLFAQGVAKMVDGYVDLLNAFGHLPKATK